MPRLNSEAIAITRPPASFPFQKTNVTDAAGTYATIEPSSSEYVMPWKGWIVAMSVRHNGALTTGTLTHRATINGTASTVLTVVTSPTSQQAYGSIEAQRVYFTAGARLGMDYTKSGTVDPVTTDLTALLFVIFEEVYL